MNIETMHGLEIEHRVKAPPEIVFSYFIDPDRHRFWLGGKADLDPRPGGLYHVQLAPGVALRGVYLEIDPPRRVVYTWGWETARALPYGVEAIGPGTTTVEVALTADGDETVVRLKHSGFPSAAFAGSHTTGWRYVFERLDRCADGSDPGPFRPDFR